MCHVVHLIKAHGASHSCKKLQTVSPARLHATQTPSEPALAPQGETVPYIICVERDGEGNVLPEQKSVAERAHHPDELTADAGLAVDVDYYLAQQVNAPSLCRRAGCQVVPLYMMGGFTREIKGHQGMHGSHLRAGCRHGPLPGAADVCLVLALWYELVKMQQY